MLDSKIRVTMESDVAEKVNDYSKIDDMALSLCMEELKKRLPGLALELTTLNGKTESEFLTIGSNLNDFYSRVGEISTSASSSADLILGKEISRAIGDFQDLQNRVDSYLNHIEAEMEQCIKKLRAILITINGITKPVSDLKDIAQMLQMLAISTRIVTVNLSRKDSSFAALAANIKNMSKLINSKSTDILGQAKSLSYMVTNAISTLNQLEKRQAGLAGEILNNTRLGLGAITRMQKKSSGAAGITKVISDRSAQISSNISEIMVSLQFHDITHQKIDHSSTLIDQSNRDLMESCGSGEGAAIGENENTIVGVFARVKFLQTELEYVKEELFKAVDGIIGNLQGIAKNVAELSSEIGRTAGSVTVDYSSFWSEMDQVMSSFTTSIREDADTSGKLNEVMTSVSGTVSNISLYVSDIEEIGSDIKLIAFNARIKAAHVGTEGASIGLLAEKIQKLSVDASAKTNVILETLNSITAYAKDLSIFDDSGVKIEDVGLDDVVSRLVDILNPLHMVDDKIISFLTSMDNNSTSLVSDIDTLISSIKVHDEVSNVLGRVVLDLEGMEENISETCPNIESMAQGYEISGTEGASRKEEGGHEDLDDNIELF